MRLFCTDNFSQSAVSAAQLFVLDILEIAGIANANSLIVDLRLSMLTEKNRGVFKTGHPVRVLIVEDSPDDAELMIRYLRKGGFKPRSMRVESAKELSSAIRNHHWDIILCDHNMPGFDSVEALRIINNSEGCAKIPFLTISDELPASIEQTLKENGANGSLSKRSMDQLVQSVVKELRNAMKNKETNPNGNKNSTPKSQLNSQKSSGISLLEAEQLPEELRKDLTERTSKNGSSNGHGKTSPESGNIKNILIVEDEMIQSILLEKLIKSLGYKVVGKVTTGADAIEMALKLQPDVITMDISLQDDIDGIMATQSIQDKSMIPVIYISGNSDQYNVERAEKTNFIDFIPKPVNKEILAKSFSKAEEISADKKS